MRTDFWSILEPVAVNPRIKSLKDVLRDLVFHANEDGEAWPSIETIRREVGYKSRKAIIDALGALDAGGLLHKSRTGFGSATRVTYHLNINETTVRLLTTDGRWVDGNVNKSAKLSTDGEVTSRDGKATSPLASEDGEVTSRVGEVTSRDGEATSPEIRHEISKNTTTTIDADGEATSRGVDNASVPGLVSKGRLAFQFPGLVVAPSARNDAEKAGRQKVSAKVAAIIYPPEIDYLARCKQPGWRPNDPKQAPDLEAAKKAVIATALRGGLSLEKTEEFWHWNAVRRWTGIDRGNTVAELVGAAVENWKRDDPNAYFAELKRRRTAAANRTLT